MYSESHHRTHEAISELPLPASELKPTCPTESIAAKAAPESRVICPYENPESQAAPVMAGTELIQPLPRLSVSKSTHLVDDRTVGVEVFACETVYDAVGHTTGSPNTVADSPGRGSVTVPLLTYGNVLGLALAQQIVLASS